MGSKKNGGKGVSLEQEARESRAAEQADRRSGKRIVLNIDGAEGPAHAATGGFKGALGGAFSGIFRKSTTKDDLAPCPPGSEPEEERPSLLRRLLGARSSRTCRETSGNLELHYDPEAHSAGDIHLSVAVSLPGLAVGVSELKRALKVRDISTTGIGIAYDGPRVKAGTELTLLLATRKKRLAAGLRARVVRHEEGVLGARFTDLEPQQEDLLGRLVLLGQKREAEQRRTRH